MIQKAKDWIEKQKKTKKKETKIYSPENTKAIESNWKEIIIGYR